MKTRMWLRRFLDKLQRPSVLTLKQIEEQHKIALEEDPFAFAYDEVYDYLKPRLHDCEERKPRYSQLLSLRKQAGRRQKEREIVYEKKLAIERAKDQHLFPYQVKVVTGPYKRKLEEREQWLSEERFRELVEEKDDVTKKTDLSDFYFNIGKNVTFGAPDIKDREAKRFKEHRQQELGKEETREEKKTGDIGSSCKKSVQLQEADQTASEKKMGSDATEEGDSSILGAAKDAPRATYQHRNSKYAIAAAKERFLARMKAKI